MARGDATARAGETSALGSSQNLQNQSNQLYSTLAPTLTSEMAHPVGLNPTEKAAANTAAQESAGGSQAGATGAGALAAQRTRNAGTADAAIQESARGAGRNLSRASLQTELTDSAMKRQQQQHAQTELGGLYGMGVQGGNAALGELANNANANTNAVNSSWDWAKDLVTPLATSGIDAYGRIMSGAGKA